jgi:hypothetical protein
LGRALTCDWLISGSLVEAGGQAHIWTKVIDVHNGVVMDLNVTPYQAGAVTNVVGRIAAFLNETGPRPQGRQFIAMGPFVDMNPPLGPKREDWSRRLAALLEKHFVEAGLGVTELAAVGPIFEERRLETAGLTGHPEGRVQLQPAFWLVDGGCEWVGAEPAKVAVGLRVQRVGGPEQLLRFTNAPGEALERELLATLSRALSNTNLLPHAGPNPEADLLAARGMELATRRSPFRPGTARTRTQWDSYKQEIEQNKRLSDNLAALLATYERTLLRDPKNAEAKVMLAYGLLRDLDPAKRERGKELLGEVIDSKDPKQSERAYRHLTNAAVYAKMAEQASPPKRPQDWQSVNQAFEENPNDPEAKCDLGAALLSLPRAGDRERGRELLRDVAAGNRADQAERARKLLAAPEKSPAIPDDWGRPKPAATETAAAAEEDDSDLIPPETDKTREHREFLQREFAKFVAVRLEKDGPDVAKFHQASVQGTGATHNGRHYCGFRFTVPPWIDGDLNWMWLFAKSEAQKEFRADGFQWGIVPKTGRLERFRAYSANTPSSGYSNLSKQFPHTLMFFHHWMSKKYLQPGQEYAVWFSFKESNVPDVACAITVQSSRGRAQAGILPLR